jgi:hypothetical protein
VEDLFAERDDETGFLGEGNELGRRHDPLARMAPARQGLQSEQLACLDVEDRLIVDFDLAIRDGVAQIGFELPPRIGVGGHPFVEEAVAVAALGFGPVEREIGLLHQCVGIDVRLAGHRDADAGPDCHHVAAEIVGSGDQRDDALGELDGGAALVKLAGLDDREFIAAEPRHQIGLAQRLLQAGGGLLKEDVAGGMAERVVDVLEAFEIGASRQLAHRRPQRPREGGRDTRP